MTTDTQIFDALSSALDDSALTYPVQWPGVKFTPPDSGVWLELFFQPNADIDNGLGYNDETIPQGFLTIMVMTRPGSGIVGLMTAIDELRDIYTKGLILSGLVRIVRKPSLLDFEPEPDRIGVGLSIEYSG